MRTYTYEDRVIDLTYRVFAYDKAGAEGMVKAELQRLKVRYDSQCLAQVQRGGQRPKTPTIRLVGSDQWKP